MSEPGFGGIFEIKGMNSQHQFSVPLCLCGKLYWLLIS